MFLFPLTEQNVSAPAHRKGRRARWRKLGSREKLPADPATMSLPQSITSLSFRLPASRQHLSRPPNNGEEDKHRASVGGGQAESDSAPHFSPRATLR